MGWKTYAADGYARIHGIGAVSTTYGVGELSAINAVAGAYAEHLPVFHLVGMPNMTIQAGHALVHHTLGNGEFDLFRKMAEPAVCASAIMTPQNVAYEIERLIAGTSTHRNAFGRPIGSFQLMQDLLAKMLANVTACQCVVTRTGQLDDQGKLTDAQAALSKSFTTVKCRETVAWGREIFGGNGISIDYNIGRFFTDAEALISYEGTSQMQNIILRKAITGLSAFVH